MKIRYEQPRIIDTESQLDGNKGDLQYISLSFPRNMLLFTFYFIRYDLHPSPSTDNVSTSELW